MDGVPSEFEGKRGTYLQIASSEKLRWIRIAAAAILFTSISLTQMWTQSVQVLKQLKTYRDKSNAGPINFDVQSQCSNFNSSVSSMWNILGDEIMKASYYPKEHALNANFTNWVNTLFQSDYQVHQMRPSAIHQPDTATMLRLLQIIHDRVEFLKSGKSATDSSPPPLHIMVMGGSVTVGMGCGENHVGLNIPGWMNKQLTCAWPSRLEHLFNQVLFQGKEVIRVSNLATGGASTEVGKVVMEYRLFTEEMKKSLPHVVIWAHAPNDSQEADKETVEYVHIPAFVHAARNLHLCDNELPLVVMLDAGKYTSVNDISTMLYKVSSWYDLMGVSHSNVVKHKLYAHHDNTTVMKAMTGGGWNLHPGMGSHIGVAWTVFFNFLKGFTESCEDGPALGYGAASKNSGDTPLLHTKHLGSYRKDEDVKSLQTRWQKDTEYTREYCRKHKGGVASEVCTHAWMVNAMTGISHPQHVNAKMNEIMLSNDGWEASGYPVRQPRTGWYARKEKATFSLKIEPTLETKFITIMSMKSYGDNFKDTTLRVTVGISRSNGDQSEKSYDINGYHVTRTSIHIPHKFELPKGGANKGDIIHVKAQLISGAYFKINGIALCTY